jgi:hypothetical protein
MKIFRNFNLILLVCNPIATLGRQSVRSSQAQHILKSKFQQSELNEHERDLATFFVTDSLICPTGADLDLLCDDIADQNLLLRKKKKRTMLVMRGKKKKTTKKKKMMTKKKAMTKKKMMKKKKMERPVDASAKITMSGKGMGHKMHSKGKAGSSRSPVDQDSSRDHVSTSSSKSNPISISNPTQMMMNMNPAPVPILQVSMSKSKGKGGKGESKSSKSGKGESKSGKGGKGESKSSKSGKGESKSSKSGKGESKSSKSGKGESNSSKSGKGGKGESKGSMSKSKGKGKRDVRRFLQEDMEIDPLVDGQPSRIMNANDDDCNDDDSVFDGTTDDVSTDDDATDDDATDDDATDDDATDDDATDDDGTDDDATDDDATDDDGTDDTTDDNTADDVTTNSMDDYVIDGSVVEAITADDENYLDDLMQKCCIAPDEISTPTFGPTTDFFVKEPEIPTVTAAIDACPSAYVYCPGKSMCFVDSAFNDGNEATDWGFNINFDSATTGTLDNCQVWTGVKGCDLSTGKQVGTATITNELFHITLKLGQYESNSFQLYSGKCVASDGGLHLQNGGVCQSSAVSVFANKADKFPMVAESRSYKSTHTFDANDVKNTVDWPGYRVFPLGTEGRIFLVGHMRVCPVEFTFAPTFVPTSSPTFAPTSSPTSKPTIAPVSLPSLAPVSMAPRLTTASPVLKPSVAPVSTSAPVKNTTAPTEVFVPDGTSTPTSSVPTLIPTTKPFSMPTVVPATMSPVVNTTAPRPFCQTSPPIALDVLTPAVATTVSPAKPTVRPVAPVTVSPLAPTVGPVAPFTVSPLAPTVGPVAPFTVSPLAPTVGPVAPFTVSPLAPTVGPVAPFTVSPLAPTVGPVAPFTVSPLAPTVGPVAPFTVSPLAPTVGPVAPFTVSPLAPTVGPVAPFTVSPLAPTVGPVAPFTVSPLAPTVGPVAPFTVSPLAPTVGPVAPFTVSPLAPTVGPVTPTTAIPIIIPTAPSQQQCKSAYVYCPGRSVCLSNITGKTDAIGWSIKYNASEGTVDNCEIYTGVQPGCNVTTATVVGKFTIMPTLVHFCLVMGQYFSNSFQMYAGNCPANDNAAHFWEGSSTCKLSDMLLYGDQYKTFPLLSPDNQTFVDSYIFDSGFNSSTTWGNYKVFNIGSTFRSYLAAHTLICTKPPAPVSPFGEAGTPAPSSAVPITKLPTARPTVSPISITPVTRLPTLSPVSIPPISTAPIPVAAISVAPVSATPITVSPVSIAPIPVATISVAPVSTAPISATPATRFPTSAPVAGPVTASPISAAPVTLVPTLSPIIATAAPITQVPTGSPVSLAPITAAPTVGPIVASKGPTSIPASNFSASECVTAFAMCESPTRSICFEELHQEKKLFGWSIMYNESYGQLDDCTLYAGLPSFGCDLSKATRVGSVSIQPDNVTYTLNPGFYESNTFSMYAGKCRGNEQGDVLTNGGFCNVERICEFADVFATYPLRSEGGPKVNTFTFDKNSPISQPWPSNYTIFPVGRPYMQFLSIQATVCTIDGKFPFTR